MSIRRTSCLLILTIIFSASSSVHLAAECRLFDGLDAMTAGDFRDAALIFDECARETPNDVDVLLNLAESVVQGKVYDLFERAEWAARSVLRFAQQGAQPVSMTEVKKSHGLLGQVLLRKAQRYSMADEHLAARIKAYDGACSELGLGQLRALLATANAELEESRARLREIIEERYSEVRSILSRASSKLGDFKRADALLNEVLEFDPEATDVARLRGSVATRRAARKSELRSALATALEARHWAEIPPIVTELRVDYPYENRLIRAGERARKRAAEITRNDGLLREAEVSRRHDRTIDLARALRDSHSVELEDQYRERMLAAYYELIDRAVDSVDTTAVRAIIDRGSHDGFELLDPPLRWWFKVQKYGELVVYSVVALVAGLIVGIAVFLGRRHLKRAKKGARKAQALLKRGDGRAALRLLEGCWEESTAFRDDRAVELIAEVGSEIPWTKSTAEDALHVLRFLDDVSSTTTRPDLLVRLAWVGTVGRYRRKDGKWADAHEYSVSCIDDASVVEDLRWVPAYFLGGLLGAGPEELHEQKKRTRKGKAATWGPNWAVPPPPVGQKFSLEEQLRMGKLLGERLALLSTRTPGRFEEARQLIPPGSGPAPCLVRWNLGCALADQNLTGDAREILAPALIGDDRLQVDDANIAPLVERWVKWLIEQPFSLSKDGELPVLVDYCTSSLAAGATIEGAAPRVLGSIAERDSVQEKIDLLQRLPMGLPGLIPFLAKCYVERSTPDRVERTVLEIQLEKEFEDMMYLHYLRAASLAGGLPLVLAGLERWGGRAASLGDLESCVASILAGEEEAAPEEDGDGTE
jgi:tetratricopeptide (TPR) repeat protein